MMTVTCSRKWFRAGVFNLLSSRANLHLSYNSAGRSHCTLQNHHGYIKHHMDIGGSPGDVGEVPITQVKQRKGCRMSCDVDKAAEGLENELWCRWSDTRIGKWGASFSKPYIVSPTSQPILQPFRRFTYATAHSTNLPLLHLVIGTSPTSQLILQPFRRFIYAIADSTTLPPLHLRHRSFYNPSVASPTSQALYVLHLASCPCVGGWKNSVVD